ncbi:MAG TPA: arginine--tRNA ligase, partial [bacterium]|nr:arginine--tRNA ligase [bacterium]
MLENKIRELVKAAILSSVQEGLLSGLDGKMEIEISVPKSEAHGDFTTNIALVVASRAKIPPRKAAEIIAAKIPLGTEGVEKVEIAGPGFINFKIDTKVYLEMLRDISVQGERYGSVDLGSGKKVQIEFVSANPTGPLHIGHGRGAVYGDALASVLSAAGYEVTK